MARVYTVDKDTVLGWLLEAAGHSEAVLGYMMHHMHLKQVQMDELYALLNGLRGEGEERGKCWVWAAIDPISKLLLAIQVGDRSLEVAQRLVHGVIDRAGTRGSAVVCDGPVSSIQPGATDALWPLDREGE